MAARRLPQILSSRDAAKLQRVKDSLGLGAASDDRVTVRRPAGSWARQQQQQVYSSRGFGGTMCGADGTGPARWHRGIATRDMITPLTSV